MAKQQSRIPFQFVIQPNSSTPAEEQVVAQLKLALMLGFLKPGETLPSVRRMEQETGIGRNIVWRAYRRLAKYGALTLEERKRPVVNFSVQLSEGDELHRIYSRASHDLFRRLRVRGINPQSFLRFCDIELKQSDEYLLQDVVFVDWSHAQARAWANEIEKVWRCNVGAFSIEEVRAMTRQERGCLRCVLTPLYFHQSVVEVFDDRKVRVIPLRMDWDTNVVRELSRIPEGSRMALVLEESERRAVGQLMAEEFKVLCPNLRIEVITFRDYEQVGQVLSSDKYARILLSKAIMDGLDPTLRGSDILLQDLVTLNKQSLEQATIQAGILI